MKLGIDIGTAMTKAALVDGLDLVWTYLTPTEANPVFALTAVETALKEEKGMDLDDIEAFAITGWGAKTLQENYPCVETIIAMGKATHWFDPDVRTAITAGAQESIIVSLDEKGNVLGYARNDKCASGAGRFLDIICEPLECTVPEMEEMARCSKKKLEMSAQCAVFAESEVVSRINDGESADDIVSAVLDTVACNVATLSRKLTTKPGYLVGGGLLSNEVIVERMGTLLDIDFKMFAPDARFLSAVGAALSAKGGQA